MSFRLGLTGSIGMGKSTTLRIFSELGHPVWDADAVVHRLYGPGGDAVGAVGASFPDVISDGAVDRDRLKQVLAQDPAALPRLEAIVHPLVARDREAFLARNAQAPLVVLDIPLLFEAGAPPDLDGVAVVSTDPQVQRMRVLARPGMTAEMLDFILARQMPDAEKRARADWVIPTDDPQTTRAAVMALVQEATNHARDRS
ncbi:MAG: dephospho-CoA kinase [Paracoccus sp. (in: a-proteobacteria)]|nr:dephospho-CoA kinase [Paracoccus sp. (in: a-proteobacteria)]